MKTKGIIKFKSYPKNSISFTLTESDGHYSITISDPYPILNSSYFKKINKQTYDYFKKKYIDNETKENCDPAKFIKDFDGERTPNEAEWIP